MCVCVCLCNVMLVSEGKIFLDFLSCANVICLACDEVPLDFFCTSDGLTW